MRENFKRSWMYIFISKTTLSANTFYILDAFVKRTKRTNHNEN